MKRLIIIYLCLILVGCGKEMAYKLPQLFSKEFTPPGRTYKVAVQVKGDFSCPFELIKLKNGNDYDHFILVGKTDTLLKGDWYGDKLSFRTSTPECVDKEGTVNVEFYYTK